MEPKIPSEAAQGDRVTNLEAELATLSAKERQLLEDNHRLRNELAAAKLKVRAADTIISRLKELLAIWK